ncbi:MAG TPA: SGNH/GDSL hydrolase family protein [Nocardioidaceae bacterium]|nr:SGNH/GDSL hydrolase family protein [Nocardioidaceae bacterium]
MTIRLALTLVLALVLAGCTGSDASAPGAGPSAPPSPPGTSGPARPGAAYDRYVALGDSYTAAPYVPSTALANGCLRSDANYPARVADALDADLVDVSCSGADTAGLTAPQHTFGSTRVPPQVDALTADTDLVTVGIGGNDLDLFGTLLETCTTVRDRAPAGAPCRDRLDRRGIDIAQQVRVIGRHVEDALETVTGAAPRARVLLVGYPRLAPERGTCPALLPLARGDYQLAREVQRGLDRVMRQAAGRADVEFVSMYAASAGHDICASDPWVNGQLTDQEAALAFHPFAEEMQAVADRVVARLED